MTGTATFDGNGANNLGTSLPIYAFDPPVGGKISRALISTVHDAEWTETALFPVQENNAMDYGLYLSYGNAHPSPTDDVEAYLKDLGYEVVA